jgi:hypothetical protein
MEVSGQFHTQAALFPGRSPRTHFIGEWVGPRAGRDTAVATAGIELRTPVSKPTELFYNKNIDNFNITRESAD